MDETQNQTIMRPIHLPHQQKPEKLTRMVAGVQVGKRAPRAWKAERKTSATFWTATRLSLYNFKKWGRERKGLEVKPKKPPAPICWIWCQVPRG